MEHGDVARDLWVTRVPTRYFVVTGIKPERGRVFGEGDAGAPVIMISHALWRELFPGRHSLEGANLMLGDRSYAVVGVMPIGAPGRAWVPLSAEAEREGGSGAGSPPLVKLRRGTTRQAAAVELEALAARLTRRHPGARGPIGLRLIGFRDYPRYVTHTQLAMLGASLAVLLIACANLASLMLARGLAKRREVALRLAIGASRVAVIRQMFAECAVLTIAGVALGVVASVWGADVLRSGMPRYLSWFGVVAPRLTWRVFVLTALAGAASAVLFGLLPAVRVARAVSLDEPLKDGAGTTGRARHRYSALVIAEVALALVLVMGAGLLRKVAGRLASEEFSFPARQLLRAGLSAPTDRRAAARDRLDFQLRVVAGVRSVPGVIDAAALTGARAPGGAVTAELTGGGTRLVTVPSLNVVTPSYLRTVGLPIVDGRDFVDGDLGGGGVAIVNEAASALLYPRDRAVGHMLKLGGEGSQAPWVPIVGVCRVATSWLPEEPGQMPPDVYVVRATAAGGGFTLLVRTAANHPRIAVAVTRRLHELIPGKILQFQGVVPYLDAYEADLAARFFLARLFVIIGSFALALAAVGLYGVLAYAVSTRRREFGVRVALGAGRGDLISLVLNDALVMVLAGIGVGAFVAFGASGFLGQVLADVAPTDAGTLIGTEVVLMVAATTASLAPALRAMRADPLEIMRAI
jgi:putative ABC transport system permease protein